MYRTFFLLCLVCVALVGCRPPQTVKNAWKETRTYYRDYLNTPASLDLDDKGDAKDYQAVLAAALADFDMQLRNLERMLQNSDRNPDPAWVTKVTTDFPWLAGLALTDNEGHPMAQVPPSYAKPFDVGSLTTVDKKQLRKDLRAYVQEDPLGPEIYVGNPVYSGDDFKGLIVVHFDPRTLIARTADPANIIIACPGGIIWPGSFDAQATPIAGVDWADKVKSNAYGTVSNDRGTFYWVTRYVGNLPLIYAVKVKGDFPRQMENLASLETAASYALGSVNLVDDEGRRLAAPQARPDLSGKAEGEVGDIGSPNVAPDAPLTGPRAPSAPNAPASPLSE